MESWGTDRSPQRWGTGDSLRDTSTSVGGSIRGSMDGIRSIADGSIDGAATPTSQYASASYGDGRMSSPGACKEHFEANTKNCAICDSLFGKRHMNPRHHCRLCGRCVCAVCAPSFIHIDGWKGTQRVCNPCVSIAARANEVRDRMAAIGQCIQKIQDPSGHAIASEPATLEDAVSLCEGAVLPLKVMHMRATDAVWATGDRLRALRATAGEADSESEALRKRGNLDAAVTYCEAAVSPVEARIVEAEMDLGEEQRRRKEAEARLMRANRFPSPWKGERAAPGATFGQADPLYASPRGERPCDRPSDSEFTEPMSGGGPEQKNCKNKCVMM